MRRTPIVLLLILGIVLVLGAAACSSTESSEPDTPAPATDTATEETATTSDDGDAAGGAEEALVESSCSLCHTTERVWAADYDRAEWEVTMDRMKQNGLVVSDEDYETIVAYLSGE